MNALERLEIERQVILACRRLWDLAEAGELSGVEPSNIVEGINSLLAQLRIQGAAHADQ